MTAFAERGLLTCREDGTIRIDRAALADLDDDLGFHLVRRAIAAVSGGAHWPDAEGAGRILSRLKGTEAKVSATLAGAIVTAGEVAEFCREFGRHGIAGEPVADDRDALLFDRRFEVAVDPWRGMNARVVAFGSLGRGGRSERTLPVLLVGEQLVAVPQGLVRKAPEAGATLPLRSLASWRLWRDLTR